MQRNNQPMMNQAVALFCPRYLDMGPYFGAIVDGIMEEVEAVNFALLTVFPGKIPPIISRGDIDGALVLMPGDQQHLVEDLRLDPGFHGRAVVSIIRELPTESNVLGDDEQGGYLVVRHLLDLGHRTLLFGHYQSPTHERRLQGGHRACREAGVDPTCVLYPFEWDSNKLQESEALLDSLLRTHLKVTGIFAPNDMAAVEIADYCRRRGIAIPDAMSLVGFDDIVSLPDAQGQNRLTTVHLDLRAVGHEAARLLVDLVRGDTTAPRTVILPVRLVIRDTTAPPRPC
jgi:DNA-binding LacI/PurR family transcriptional regulator